MVAARSPGRGSIYVALNVAFSATYRFEKRRRFDVHFLPYLIVKTKAEGTNANGNATLKDVSLPRLVGEKTPKAPWGRILSARAVPGVKTGDAFGTLNGDPALSSSPFRNLRSFHLTHPLRTLLHHRGSPHYPEKRKVSEP